MRVTLDKKGLTQIQKGLVQTPIPGCSFVSNPTLLGNPVNDWTIIGTNVGSEVIQVGTPPPFQLSVSNSLSAGVIQSNLPLVNNTSYNVSYQIRTTTNPIQIWTVLIGDSLGPFLLLENTSISPNTTYTNIVNFTYDNTYIPRINLIGRTTGGYTLLFDYCYICKAL